MKLGHSHRNGLIIKISCEENYTYFKEKITISRLLFTESYRKYS